MKYSQFCFRQKTELSLEDGLKPVSQLLTLEVYKCIICIKVFQAVSEIRTKKEDQCYIILQIKNNFLCLKFKPFIKLFENCIIEDISDIPWDSSLLSLEEQENDCVSNIIAGSLMIRKIIKHIHIYIHIHILKTLLFISKKMYSISDISSVFLKVSKAFFTFPTKGKAAAKELMSLQITQWVIFK